MSEQHLSKIQFSSFGLPAELMQGIEESGFSYCTPIQAETLPIALQGTDISGQAQTGTGKTAAFLVAAFAHLLSHPPVEERKPNQPRMLVIAPTRELAVQIYNDAIKLGAHTGLKMAAIYGGTGYEQQRATLEAGVEVLIGTPGRIIDYFKQHVFNLKALQVMVLDEADRMFDLGFIKDIRYLFRRMPPPDKRLSMLFSATLSHRVKELAYEHMNNPQTVEIKTEKVTAERIEEILFYPAKEEKIPLLLGLLKQKNISRGLVFVNTKHVGEKVTNYLLGNDIRAGILSGDVPQKKRLGLLDKLGSGEINIMVATDVAARGLHIPEVSHVFNYDLPQDAEDYVHRIGRTGRAGASGEAISFACEEYVYSLPDIEEYIGHRIPSASIEQGMLAELKPPKKSEHKRRSHGGGDRKKSSSRRRRPSPPRNKSAAH